MFVYAADGLYVKPQEVKVGILSRCFLIKANVISIKVLQIEIGQRYSVMIRLDQAPDNYYLRFASYPDGDMQQVIEGQAIVSYDVSLTRQSTLTMPKLTPYFFPGEHDEQQTEHGCHGRSLNHLDVDQRIDRG